MDLKGDFFPLDFNDMAFDRYSKDVKTLQKTNKKKKKKRTNKQKDNSIQNYSKQTNNIQTNNLTIQRKITKTNEQMIKRAKN